ncbi:unnamed protein product [Camellia sinensis]
MEVVLIGSSHYASLSSHFLLSNAHRNPDFSLKAHKAYGPQQTTQTHRLAWGANGIRAHGRWNTGHISRQRSAELLPQHITINAAHHSIYYDNISPSEQSPLTLNKVSYGTGFRRKGGTSQGTVKLLPKDISKNKKTRGRSFDGIITLNRNLKSLDQPDPSTRDGQHYQIIETRLRSSLSYISSDVNDRPRMALTEEIRLFLEAWRTIDRAYVDKNFNGQKTYKAIRKMLATLDDPFTRFLEPEKFKSLRLGTQGSLTGVGLSIGYPTGGDGSTAGLVVISTAPGGPANKAGILSGDVILKIDDTSTETMGIYDAADRLQGPEGSAVELTIQSGPEIKHLSLVNISNARNTETKHRTGYNPLTRVGVHIRGIHPLRERVSLNPVQSRLCEITGLGREDSKVGYIKLTSFNQNASGAVREAIETLRRNNVNAFVLDLRDNRLEKGVIVYICDSQGVRDIYDTDGSNAIAAREPLAVLHKIQSVFELSDGSGLAVTVARYETPAHTDIDKVGVVPDHPLPVSFPKDDQGFCSCLQDLVSACYLSKVKLFSR